MKRFIFMQLLKRIQQTPDIKRKIKIFATFAVFVTLLLGAGVIYTGYLGISYLSNIVQKINLSETAPNVSEPLRLPTVIAKKECLAVAKSLLDIQTLFNQPLGETAKTFKNTCLDTNPKEIQPKEESTII